MALDIMEMLVGVLCPTNDAARTCTDFINAQSHQVMAPIGPLFYFLLFPSVFIILFIYFLSEFVISEHKGLRLLVGVTAFIFIIISGWYPLFLVLSEIWYIATIILVGFWIFLKRLKGGGKKGSGDFSLGNKASGGIIGEVNKRLNKKIKKRTLGAFGLMTEAETAVWKIEKKLEKNHFDVSSLTDAEFMMLAEQLNISPSTLRDMKSSKLKDFFDKERKNTQDLQKAA